MLFGTLVQPGDTDLKAQFDAIIGEGEVFEEPLTTFCNSITSLMFQQGMPRLGFENVIYSKHSVPVPKPLGAWVQTTIPFIPNAWWHLAIIPSGSVMRFQVLTPEKGVSYQFDWGADRNQDRGNDIILILPGEKFIQSHITVRRWFEGPILTDELYTIRMVDVV